jgi:hypothetical protein
MSKLFKWRSLEKPARKIFVVYIFILKRTESKENGKNLSFLPFLFWDNAALPIAANVTILSLDF